MQALSPYFLVKIKKEDQLKNKEKIGSIYLAQTHTRGERGIQAGEIVSISQDAHEQLPEAEVGDTLLFHWMVEFEEEGENESFMEEDEVYNYYNVTSKEFNGRKNETYGVFKDDKIIPNKDYIFLHKEEIYSEVNTTTTAGGLIVFKNWNESREVIAEKSKRLKSEIESLSKGTMTDQIKREIELKERESRENANRLNAKKYVPFSVDYVNPIHAKRYGLKTGDCIYCLGMAAETTITFKQREYIVAPFKYVAGKMS